MNQQLLEAMYPETEFHNSFTVDVSLHLLYGYVIATPEAFIMGRAIQRNADINLIRDPSVSFDDPDCWWVWLAVGVASLEVFFRHEPYPLPYFGWDRRGKARFYERERLIHGIEKRQNSKSSRPSKASCS